MSTLLTLLFLTLLVPALLGSSYLLLLTLLSRALPITYSTKHQTHFDILVPAHNEAQVITRTLHSLTKLDWPVAQYRVLVIADNCTDQTADLARQAGVIVIERQHDTLRGKGYALELGIAHSADDAIANAVVVIDADSEVDANLLTAMAARLENGAQAIQAHYGVLNPEASWRTRLMSIAYGAFHAVRSRARERMKVSCGLRGNGMCFSHDLLQQYPPKAYSLAEDVEYGALLGLHGIRVYYADETNVRAELPISRQGADSQRQRWEKGRLIVARDYAGRLLMQAYHQRSTICLDLALDLLTLPIGYLILNIILIAGLACLTTLFIPEVSTVLLVCAILLVALMLHVFRGWQLSPLGPRALLDLLRVPFFIVWKILVLLRNRKNTQWIRTRRNNDKP